MANYQYIARTAAGAEVTGEMQADNEQAVVRSLDEKKLFPIRVTQQTVTYRGRGGSKVSVRELGVVYGQLADLLRAGVPMLRSMETLTRAITSKKLADLVGSVRDEIAAGKTLADAMGQHPKVFAPLHCAMIRAGERAGFLEDVLANLAGFLERQDELQSKVRGAMIYPMLLTVIGSIMMVGVLMVLVPRFQGFFKGMPLPVPTMILFSLSEMMTQHAALLAALLALAGGSVWVALHSQAGQALWDRWRLKMPLLGRAMTMVALTRFCRILGTMLANGVPILQSLSISKDAAGSGPLAESIEMAAENVRAGQPLAEPLKACGLFPAEIVEMIAVAEESNQLEKVLVHIADTVERRTTRQVDQAVRLIEPLILVMMASMIGFVAVGLLYPIFTMSQTIK